MKERTPEELDQMLKDQFCDDIETLAKIDYWEALVFAYRAVGEWWRGWWQDEGEPNHDNLS